MVQDTFYGITWRGLYNTVRNILLDGFPQPCMCT